MSSKEALENGLNKLRMIGINPIHRNDFIATVRVPGRQKEYHFYKANQSGGITKLADTFGGYTIYKYFVFGYNLRTAKQSMFIEGNDNDLLSRQRVVTAPLLGIIDGKVVKVRGRNTLINYKGKRLSLTELSKRMYPNEHRVLSAFQNTLQDEIFIVLAQVIMSQVYIENALMCDVVATTNSDLNVSILSSPISMDLLKFCYEI